MDNLSQVELHPSKPLRDIVFEHLREAILDGRLLPKQRLMEIQLAEILGVSRTPIREAIRKLELEGLIIMTPRKGAYVADVSLKEVIEVLEVRASLEGLGAILAAKKATEEGIIQLEKNTEELEKYVKEKNLTKMIEWDGKFHDILFSQGKNEKLIYTINSLRTQVRRFRVIYFTEYEVTSEKIIDEHKNIIKALKERDEEKAFKMAKEHIYEIRNFFLEKESQEKLGE